MAPPSPTDELVLSSTFRQRLINDNCSIGEPLQSGSYATVYRGKYKGRDAAIKVFDKKRMNYDQLNKNLPREIEAMRKLRHPNIVITYWIVEDNSTTLIFMQLAEKGDLTDIMAKRVESDTEFTEAEVKIWMRQVVGAVKFMHVKGYAHRDLKCDNILIDKHNNVLIADFGFARKLPNQELCSTMCGSRPYTAPEVLRVKEYNPLPIDIWSIGVIAFTLVMSKNPFSCELTKEMIKKQKAKEYVFEKPISDDGKDFIEKLLQYDPKMRLTASQCLEHPWLALPTETSTSTPSTKSKPESPSPPPSSKSTKKPNIITRTKAQADRVISYIKSSFD